MTLMAAALQKAGLITDHDFARVKKQQEREGKEEQERRKMMLRWEGALSGMVGLRTEVERHIREHPGSLSLELVEKWVSEIKRQKGYQDQYRTATRQWAMYLEWYRRTYPSDLD